VSDSADRAAASCAEHALCWKFRRVRDLRLESEDSIEASGKREKADMELSVREVRVAILPMHVMWPALSRHDRLNERRLKRGRAVRKRSPWTAPHQTLSSWTEGSSSKHATRDVAALSSSVLRCVICATDNMGMVWVAVLIDGCKYRAMQVPRMDWGRRAAEGNEPRKPGAGQRVGVSVFQADAVCEVMCMSSKPAWACPRTAGCDAPVSNQPMCCF